MFVSIRKHISDWVNKTRQIKEPEMLDADFKYKYQVYKYADIYHLDPVLIQSIIRTESSCNPKAYRYEPGFYSRYLKNSPYWKKHQLACHPRRISASYGLMQIMFTTAVEFGFDSKRAPEDLYDVDTNIDYGCKILRNKINKYGLLLGILAYNSGSPLIRYGEPRVQPNFVYLKKVAKFYKNDYGDNRSIIDYA